MGLPEDHKELLRWLSDGNNLLFDPDFNVYIAQGTTGIVKNYSSKMVDKLQKDGMIQLDQHGKIVISSAGMRAVSGRGE